MNTDERSNIEHYFDRLWPILRSLTGEGVRKTHDILGELVPLRRIEIPSGTQCFDWTVPREWMVRQAYFVAPDGRKLCDVSENNLHLLNYSAPFRGRVPLAELQSHLFSLPDQPDAIPYVTSYYKERWGFCLSQKLRESLPDGPYDVVIDTAFIPGSMTISEAILPGESSSEVLLSTYTCHPSLANNELSGPLVTAFLYRRLAGLPHRHWTYRFVFLPETIGSIAYLASAGAQLRQSLIAGYVVNCAGDPAPFTYKRSRRGDTIADRAAEHVLSHRTGSKARIYDFFPTGSDERQYCSPAFDLPVGSIMRSMYGTYPEYHTSLDNRDFISFAAMTETVDVYFDVCQAIEANRTYINRKPRGEPQLGKYGLYPTLGTPQREAQRQIDAIMWLLNLADGSRDLLSIAARSGLSWAVLHDAAVKCVAAGIVADANG